MYAAQRVREGAEVVSTPLVGCRQMGSQIGFGYARLRVGEPLNAKHGEGIDFLARDSSGQRVWQECEEGSKIYERVRRGPAHAQDFRFGANGHANGHASGAPFAFGGAGGGMGAANGHHRAHNVD